MGREFISPDDSYDQADSILAESADHSTATDHSHYAVVQGGVPRLSNNSMCKHRWLGDQWHSLLGLGPLPPPEAIRITKRNVANGSTFQTMSAQLMKAVQTNLDSFFATQFKETLKDSISAVLREHDKELGIPSRGASSQGLSEHLDNSSECKPASSQVAISFDFCRPCNCWGVLTSCERLHGLPQSAVELAASSFIHSKHLSLRIHRRPDVSKQRSGRPVARR